MTEDQGIELARNSLWSGIGSIGNSIGTLICSIAIARILGPEGAGHWAYIIWLSATVGAIMGFGLPETLTRYIAECRGKNLQQQANDLISDILKSSFFFTVIGCIITIAILVNGNNYTIQILYISGFLFIAQQASILARAYLCGEQKFQLLAYWMIASTITQILLIFIGSHIWGVAGAVGSYGLGVMVLGLSLGYAFKQIRYENFSQSHFYERVKNYALITWLSTIISMLVWQRMEIAFLQHYYNSREVGIFSVGLTTASIVSQAPVYFSGALVPFFAQNFGQNDNVTISRTFFFGIKFIGALIFPICFIGAALSQPLVEFLYGSTFSDSSIVAAIMLIATAFGGTSTVQTALVQGMNQPWFICIAGIIGIVLITIVGFKVIPVWGIVGATIGKASIQILMVLLGTWYITQVLKFPFPFISLLKIITASTVCGVSAYICYYALRGWIGFLVAGLIGVVSYILFGRIIRLWSVDEKKLISRLVEGFCKHSSFRYQLISRCLEIL